MNTFWPVPVVSLGCYPVSVQGVCGMNAKNQEECRDPEGEVTQGGVSGPQEAGGEAKPHVAMEMRSGPGEGLSNDNDCFEAALGLAPSSPGIPAFWVPLERQGKERILPLRQSLRFHKPFHMHYLM